MKRKLIEHANGYDKTYEGSEAVIEAIGQILRDNNGMRMSEITRPADDPENYRPKPFSMNEEDASLFKPNKFTIDQALQMLTESEQNDIRFISTVEVFEKREFDGNFGSIWYEVVEEE